MGSKNCCLSVLDEGRNQLVPNQVHNLGNQSKKLSLGSNWDT